MIMEEAEGGKEDKHEWASATEDPWFASPTGPDPT